MSDYGLRPNPTYGMNAVTPKVDSKPVETAYVLNTPVSMGPSNTTGRLMMLANASNASTVSRESLAWALFAFWYKKSIDAS